MLTLAIETSCDETSAAVLKDKEVLSNIISSQIQHKKYGGIVPEIASREHLKNIIEITDTALNKADVKLNRINLISATAEPGLIGALLVGLNFAKSLAISLGVPFVPVNHIQSHLYSNFLCGQKDKFPFIGLIVSGGHTLLVLAEDFAKHKIIGQTTDDAAGEAFDKVAKLLGLGYPGGPEIDRLAKTGNENFHTFPKAKIKGREYDFSFSGIKTSVLYFLKDKQEKDNLKFISDVSASFQKAVTDDLFEKTLAACKKFNVKDISVSGGVSANSGLRKKFNLLKKQNYNIYFPLKEYSTDNAAMIGLTALLFYNAGENKKYFETDSFKSSAKARLDYENF